MLKSFKVSELLPGMMVTQVIEQHGPVKIRKVGFIRSPDMIKGLTEMGVTVVEVDVAQSLHDDTEDQDQARNVETASVNLKPTQSTATQRLVASNKQIADVDRQLSQQFHRSLFLPAVDQMPSKWRLYGKPYALLVGVILLGVSVGFIASYSLLGGFSAITPNIHEATSQSSLPVNRPSEAALVSPTSENGSASLAPTIPDTPASNATPNVGNGQNAQQISTPMSTESAANTASSNANSGVNTAQSAPKLLTSSVSGVLLEEGQKVLGYQSGNDEVETNVEPIGANSSASANSAASSPPINVSTPAAIGNNRDSLNPDLLRRITAAAQDVDNQLNEPAPEIIKVTDLNALPRIDQLSPAILTQMPAMSFSAHMYASNARDRWVRVNSRRVGEGEIIANNVILKRIEPEKVVLEYKGTEFTMNALSDW